MRDDLRPGQGAIPSPQDYRDIPAAAVAGSSDLPASFFIDLAGIPVWHQRKIGACVGHGAAKYKQIIDLEETGDLIPYSSRFLYAMAKARDGYKPEGTYPRLVAKILKDVGCATEDVVPNDTTLGHEAYVYGRDESKIPGRDAAAPGQIGGYAFPDHQSSLSLRRAVVESKGAMLLMDIGEEWWTRPTGGSTWDSKHIVPLRPPKEKVSGHLVYLYGYDRDQNNRLRFYILNSWSDAWADNGTAFFYFEEYRPFLREAITFTDIPNDIAKRVSELPDAASFRHRFTADIRAGQRGAEVQALQTALMIDGAFDRNLYATLLKEGSLGFFGPVTQRALVAWQMRFLVQTGQATVSEINNLQGRNAGPKTRAALNRRFGGV
jgi:hypothetical protein